MDIDFTLLQKKGLLKIEEEKDEVLDFTHPVEKPVSAPPAQEPSGGMFDFFDKPQETSYYSNDSTNSTIDLNSIASKIDQLENRLGDIERLLREALHI